MSRKIISSREIGYGNILIVCEGERTENYFIRDLFEYLHNNGQTTIEQIDIDPYPKKEDEEHILEGATRQRGTRALVNNADVPLLESYPVPLNWVMKAYKGLNSYSEAWILFDHDDHPARKEAYEKIKDARIQESKNINLAFSSRSFEFFMLQHFEYLFHTFFRTECHDNNHKYLGCCRTEIDHRHGPFPGACDGELENNCCINGYARRRNYWVDSKCSDIFRGLPNIWKGIVNSYKIKWHSIYLSRTDYLYDRNPFLNTYRIILRFMNLIPIEQDLPISLGNILIKHEGTQLRVINNSSQIFLLTDSNQSIYAPVYNHDDKLAKVLLSHLPRLLLYPDHEKIISLDVLNQQPESFLILMHNGKNYFVTNSECIDPPLSEEEKSNLNLCN